MPADQISIETPAELAEQYTFKELLGEGANGKTWLASTNKTKELVAIKQLKLSKIDNIKSYDLFMREAEVIRSIRHQGVPRFYDFIVEKDGRCYLIQEYVRCPSLQSYIDDCGRIDEQSVLDMMKRTTDILVALQTQYSPPVVHRDIKPSNLLCDWNRDKHSFSKLYLIDFGAVANPQVKSSGSTVAGTFGYMAPEQLLGDVTVQSDFYALGATALHCLTGIVPWKLPVDVFAIQLDEALDEHAPDVSPNMRALLKSLLAPDKNNRPGNARVLRNMINNVMIGRMPDDDAGGSICDDYMRDIQNVYSNEFSITVQKTDMNRWHIAYGMVRSITYGTTCERYKYQVGYSNKYMYFNNKISFMDSNIDNEMLFLIEEQTVKCISVEYTFDVLGELYCGVALMLDEHSEINRKIYKFVSNSTITSFSTESIDKPNPEELAMHLLPDVWKKRELPFTCIVRYNPKNPCYSYLDIK